MNFDEEPAKALALPGDGVRLARRHLPMSIATSRLDFGNCR
jgi:hypothetical protein